MKDLKNFDYIDQKLSAAIAEKKPVAVGNHLNQYITLEDCNDYVESLRRSSDGVLATKGRRDTLMGRLVEEILIYLLRHYFDYNNLDFQVNHPESKHVLNTIALKNTRVDLQKKFDVDLWVQKRDCTEKLFLISAKGTTRERIGQFLSHLFLMDQDVLEAKYATNYPKKYVAVYHEEGIKIKYAFVTMDWSKNKDFLRCTAKGKPRKTLKETEVHLIQDDHKIGGGLYVLNDHDNLNRIGNFSTLVGAITKFLEDTSVPSA